MAAKLMLLPAPSMGQLGAICDVAALGRDDEVAAVVYIGNRGGLV